MATINTYYSTFISGFSKTVEKALSEHLKHVTIELVLDGLIIYRTSSFIEEIKQLPFFNNSFLLVNYIKKENGLIDIITNTLHNYPNISQIFSEQNTFRIIASKENQLTKIPYMKLQKLERLFKELLDLEVERSNPDIEVWFLERNEGYAFCGIRLTKKPNTEKYLQKGELRPELAWLLCYLSEPSRKDVILDPFSGQGSIPLSRSQFPFKKIIASDNDQQKVDILKLKAKDKNIEINNWQATNLSLINDSSIDKIITDPPWGLYENKNIENLYSNMLTEFIRILKIDGRIILLTAQKELLEKLITIHKEFILEEKYNILVSGKKAGVYKIKKVINPRDIQ